MRICVVAPPENAYGYRQIWCCLQVTLCVRGVRDALYKSKLPLPLPHAVDRLIHSKKKAMNSVISKL